MKNFYLLLTISFFLINSDSFCQTYSSSLYAGKAPETIELNPLKVQGMYGMAGNSNGEIFICDQGNHLIRKIQTDKKIITVAGSTQGYTDGLGTEAKFSSPKGIVLDSEGNLFVIENSTCIRKITPEGMVSTFAGSRISSGDVDETGVNARFGTLGGIAIDNSDNLYVTDKTSNKIKKITNEGVVTTLMTFHQTPNLITINKGSNIVYFTQDLSSNIYSFFLNDPSSVLNHGTLESFNVHSISMIYCPDNSMPYVSTFNGFFRVGQYNDITKISSDMFYSGTTVGSGGLAFGAYQNLYRFNGASTIFENLYTVNTTIFHDYFKNIQGIVTDSDGNIFIADRGNNRILKIDTDKVITTFAGGTTSGFVDGAGADARFKSPGNLYLDNNGDLYVSDLSNAAIRKITPEGEVTTVSDPNGNPIYINNCAGIAKDEQDNLYVAIYGGAQEIKKITPAGVMSTYLDNQFFSNLGHSLGMPYFLLIDNDGNLIIGVQMDGVIFIVSPDKSQVRRIGNVANRVSSGTHTSTATFKSIQGLTMDENNNLYVMDANIVRKISPDSSVTLIAGGLANISDYKEGSGSGIRFNYPWGITVNNQGIIFISDNGNNVVRKLSPSKTDQTITFEEFPDVTFGEETLLLSANSSSSLPVTFTSSNPQVATISENIVTILSPGTTEITANQEGNDFYYPAPSISKILTVNKGTQTITFEAFPEFRFGDPDFELTALTSSGLSLIYTSSDPEVATVNGNVISIIGVGTTVITASQLGNEFYEPAEDISQVLLVTIPTNVDSQFTTGINVFPNPTSGNIYFSIENLSLENPYLILLDSKGNELENKTISNNQLFVINLEKYSTGLYFARLLSNDNQLIKVFKIIKD